MVNKRKRDALHNLSKQLQLYRPDLKSHFICPICLNVINLKHEELISEAHIIPKAAGGKLSTFACKSCNNTLGAMQDKWFGEYLKATKSSIGLLSTKPQRFRFGDIECRGKLGIVGRQKDKTEIVISVDYGKNPPGIPQQAMQMLEGVLNPCENNIGKGISLGINLPILGKMKLVNVGFLTAGYLLWFKTFGYSWVFQSYLSPIREQIKSPEAHILPDEYIGNSSNASWIDPWIGVVNVKQEWAFIFGIQSQFVLFPTRSNLDLYLKLKESNLPPEISSMINLKGIEKLCQYPICLAHENHILMGPDNVETLRPNVIQISEPLSIGSTLKKVKYEDFKSKSAGNIIGRMNIEGSDTVEAKNVRLTYPGGVTLPPQAE